MEKLKFIKPKLIKPTRLFLGMPLAILSLEIYLGIILGYLVGKFFSGEKTGIEGRIKSLIFNIGKWKIHLHHWLYGLAILIFIFLVHLPLPQFSFAILGGLIFQGIFCYSDWHKVIIKQKK